MEAVTSDGVWVVDRSTVFGDTHIESICLSNLGQMCGVVIARSLLSIQIAVYDSFTKQCSWMHRKKSRRCVLAFNTDDSLIALALQHTVEICDSRTGHIVCTIKQASVDRMIFSKHSILLLPRYVDACLCAVNSDSTSTGSSTSDSACVSSVTAATATTELIDTTVRLMDGLPKSLIQQFRCLEQGTTPSIAVFESNGDLTKYINDYFTKHSEHPNAKSIIQKDYKIRTMNLETGEFAGYFDSDLNGVKVASFTADNSRLLLAGEKLENDRIYIEMFHSFTGFRRLECMFDRTNMELISMEFINHNIKDYLIFFGFSNRFEVWTLNDDKVRSRVATVGFGHEISRLLISLPSIVITDNKRVIRKLTTVPSRIVFLVLEQWVRLVDLEYYAHLPSDLIRLICQFL